MLFENSIFNEQTIMIKAKCEDIDELYHEIENRVFSVSLSHQETMDIVQNLKRINNLYNTAQYTMAAVHGQTVVEIKKELTDIYNKMLKLKKELGL